MSELIGIKVKRATRSQADKLRVAVTSSLGRHMTFDELFTSLSKLGLRYPDELVGIARESDQAPDVDTQD